LFKAGAYPSTTYANVPSTREEIMSKKPVKKTVKKKLAIKNNDARKQWEYETYSVSLENDVPDFDSQLGRGAERTHALAFRRTGNPNTGDSGEPSVLKSLNDVPNSLDES
jgi:hypothetical protein